MNPDPDNCIGHHRLRPVVIEDIIFGTPPEYFILGALICTLCRLCYTQSYIEAEARRRGMDPEQLLDPVPDVPAA